MNSRLDSINRWVALGANLGVVLGLFILVVELRQNAAMTRLSLEVSKNALLAEAEFRLADPAQAEVWVKSYTTPEALTDAEARRVEAFLVAMMLQWDYVLQMKKAGLADRADVENHIRNSAPYYFGSRFAKRWFDQELAGWRGTEMEAIAAPIVRAVDDDFLRKRTEALRLPAPEETAP